MLAGSFTFMCTKATSISNAFIDDLMKTNRFLATRVSFARPSQCWGPVEAAAVRNEF